MNTLQGQTDKRRIRGAGRAADPSVHGLQPRDPEDGMAARYVPIPPRTPDAPAPEHVGRTGGTFWMDSLDGDPAQRALVVEMVRIAGREGFRVGLHVSHSTSASDARATIAAALGATPGALDAVLTVVSAGECGSVWSQDHGWYTADGRQLRVVPMLGERARKHARAFQAEHGYHRISEAGYLGLMGEDWSSLGLAQLGAHLGIPTQELDVYVEGGDLLVGTHPDGRPWALVGTDSLVLSCFVLEEAGAFDAGLERGPFPRALVTETRHNLARVRGRPHTTAEAAAFLARLQRTRERIAQRLSIPLADLHFPTQPDAHLDQAMMLLGPDEVALNDHGAWLPVLDEILGRSGLGRQDRVDLEQLRREAASLDAQVGPVLDTVAAELEAAGLRVARFAGATGRCTPDPSFDHIDWVSEVDFVNSIVLLGSDGEPVCITNASHLPGVQEAFEAQLRERFGFARVHFVGGEPVPDDLRAFGANYAEISRRSDGGILCRTRWQPDVSR